MEVWYCVLVYTDTSGNYKVNTIYEGWYTMAMNTIRVLCTDEWIPDDIDVKDMGEQFQGFFCVQVFSHTERFGRYWYSYSGICTAGIRLEYGWNTVGIRLESGWNTAGLQLDYSCKTAGIYNIDNTLPVLIHRYTHSRQICPIAAKCENPYITVSPMHSTFQHIHR